MSKHCEVAIYTAGQHV